MTKKETRKINVVMPLDHIARLDEYAERMSITRTAAIMVLTSMALDSQKALSDLGELIKISKIQEQAVKDNDPKE